MLLMNSSAAPNSRTPPEPSEAPPGVRRLVLVPGAKSARGDGSVRRFRVARLQAEPRGAAPARAERFAHLKVFHD
jgi:hypothetical protein